MGSEMKPEDYKKAINYWNKKESKEKSSELLKPAVDEFLANSSVCALATGWTVNTYLDKFYKDKPASLNSTGLI